MELEEQEGFNNNHNYHSKPYKSSSTKKYHGERSPVYNLNGILNKLPILNDLKFLCRKKTCFRLSILSTRQNPMRHNLSL